MKNAKNVLNIDNHSVEFTEGQTILEVALEAGIYIPTLCYMKDLTPYAGCRLCIIKVKGMKGYPTACSTPAETNMEMGYPTACSTPAETNMEITTNDEELKELRIEVLNLILSEHPFSCFVCEEKNNCEEERGSESKAGRAFGCFSCSVREDCDLRRVTNYLEIKDVNYQLEYRDSPLKRNNPFIEMDPNMCILCGKCVRICNELKNIGA
ncbi:MAG: 2Fe-2S iron-sulfur cluster-binding protein, partial [Promethearchaeota archaeon]